MLFAKMKENKNGRQTLLGRLLVKGDPMIVSLGKKTQGILSYHWERSFYLFLVHIPSRIEAFFGHVKSKAHGHYHEVSSKMRDQREFSKNSASPYMRSMPMRRDGEAGSI